MKIILGIAGEIAGGKGALANHIKEKYNGSVHRFSSVLRDVAKRMHLEENRSNLQKISTIFRENFSSNILSEVVYHDVMEDEHEIIVIDGVRRIDDIEYLKKLPEFKLVYIEAEMEIRYERLIKRRENSDDAEKTFEEFKADHEREAELQIKDLKNYADFNINNDGTFLEFYHQIDSIIDGLRK